MPMHGAVQNNHFFRNLIKKQMLVEWPKHNKETPITQSLMFETSKRPQLWMSLNQLRSRFDCI